MPSYPVSFMSILMVSSPLYLAVASSPFLKCNPPKSLTHFASSPYVHASSILFLVDEDDLVRSTNHEPTDDGICSLVLLFHLRPNYYRKHPVLADSLCFPLFFLLQCRHMSLMDFVVSPPGCGQVQPTVVVGTPIKHNYVVPMRWVVIFEYEVPGGALNLNYAKYPDHPDHGHHGDLPL
jgi:hypothetical protein